MYEAGRAGALAEGTIAAIVKELGLDVDLTVLSDAGSSGVVRAVLKYCPVDGCPSNIPYVIGGELFFKPAMQEGRAEEKGHCSLCGEILQDRCPNEECKAPVVEGGCCSRCGAQYVTVTEELDKDPEGWADERRKRIVEVMSMSETRVRR